MSDIVYGGQGQLSIVSSVSGSDMLVINQGSSRRYRAVSVDDLGTYFADEFAANAYLSLYYAPNATGFSIALGPVAPLNPTLPWTEDFWVLVTPVAGYAAGTITLPPNTYLRDKQRIVMFFTQSVGTITWVLNGALASFGIPTTIGANGYFTLQYDMQTNSWYRVA